MTTRRRRPPVTASKVEETVAHVDAVLGADMHYRADVPRCRTDDYMAAQDRKVKFIFDLCRKHEVPFLHGGDIGDWNQWPDWLLERFMALASGVRILTALGQHDLPGHSLSQLPASGAGVLRRAGAIELIGLHWGQALEEGGWNNVLVMHRMVIDGLKDWEGQEATSADALLKAYPERKLILTGDNHKPFVVRSADGRMLVNPGSMMRMTAAQADHKPRVYLWDAEANAVAPVYLPIEVGVVSREHIEDKAQRKNRMEAFVGWASKGPDVVGLSFEKNLENHFQKNRTARIVEQKVWAAVEEGKNGKDGGRVAGNGAAG